MFDIMLYMYIRIIYFVRAYSHKQIVLILPNNCRVIAKVGDIGESYPNLFVVYGVYILILIHVSESLWQGVLSGKNTELCCLSFPKNTENFEQILMSEFLHEMTTCAFLCMHTACCCCIIIRTCWQITIGLYTVLSYNLILLLQQHKR